MDYALPLAAITLGAAIVNGAPPAFRAFAMGLNVLFIHMLGDAISPTLIGSIADAASLHTAIEVNALPVLLGGLALMVGGLLLERACKVPGSGRPGYFFRKSPAPPTYSVCPVGTSAVTMAATSAPNS